MAKFVVKKQSFGKVGEREAQLIRVVDETSGFEVDLSDFGATLVDVKVPDKHGKVESVTLSHATADDYRTKKGYWGATVGRVANRIANARFELEGRTYQLPVNNANLHSLHGGNEGFNVRFWD